LAASLRIEVLSSLAAIDPGAWNALVGADDPFLEHEFVSALEASRVVGADTAWEMRFVTAFEGGKPVAALPLFLKWDSYGEFVFDWAWAEAYQRAGMRYYPKLVAAAPLTPVAGRRLLGAASDDAILDALLARADRVAIEEDASSLHVLFAEPDEVERLTVRGFLPRVGYQFHWFNHGYSTFADFLADLRSSKRKQIAKERRTVGEQGLDIETLAGDGIRAEHMEALWRFYVDTNERKWSQAYLDRRSFLELGERFRHRLVLVLARSGDTVVAGTLNARKGRALYGRYWGASGEYPCLHFECCYYRLIDYAIEHGLERVEAGAQGEHKFLRGYVTRPLMSAHKLLAPGAHSAIGEWLATERRHILATIDAYNRQSPLKDVRARPERV
jgi:predicted N-acyltransferase